MKIEFALTPMALAAITAISSLTLAASPQVSMAAKAAGKYVAGDFHNHTTCSDGSISMEKLVKKATGTGADGWALDWFVQAGHGNSGGTRNCTLTEDATLDTPLYPFVAGTGPTTTWTASIGNAKVKGDTSAGVGYMWRWQSIQEYQYPLIEYLNAYKGTPLFVGLESIVAGHEHSSMTVITGQIPLALDNATLPTTALPITGQRYTSIVGGNADALAQWNYCFDFGDTDTSRGNVTGTNNLAGTGTGNNWQCAVPGSNSSSDVSWNALAQKLIPAGGTGTGTRGHLKTLEGLKWMAAYHPNASYYVPAHLERAGPFYADGNNGYNIEHLRDFNNTAPNIAFGMESQPGHGAANNRGEYQIKRNNINGVLTDSVGGTTFGGTGVYAAQIGGVWDALLGEGRNFWFFASSDWHARGNFGPDDRRSTQDFQPGEYQRNYTMVRNGSDKIRPQYVVNGLRTGNNFATSGQLIDRLAFIACASYPGIGARTNAAVEALALSAAQGNTDIDVAGCSTMGEKLKVRPGADIVVSIVARDPSGPNNAPYTFANPSLAQIGITQPINAPVLDHIDVIRGLVSGYKTPGAADYSGAWPTNTTWMDANGNTAGLGVVPAAAKNTSAAVIKTFSNTTGSSGWTSVGDYRKMTFRIAAVAASQYVRLRGTNLPPSVPFETDASGNPLADLYTNQNDLTKLTIPCKVTATAAGTVFDSAGNMLLTDGCPDHLPSVTIGTIGGINAGYTGKVVAFDIAAWSDLWFYSNPIYVEVAGSTAVAGVN